jgi:hypothetical protein
MDNTQQALAHLEQHKVLDPTTNTYMVPLEQAMQAVVMSVDVQLEQVLKNLDNFALTLTQDIQDLQKE